VHPTILKKFGRVLAGTLVSASACMTYTASAKEAVADYPSRPIRLIVGYAPGGSTDIAARLVAMKLGQALGQAIVVENKAGAGSNIASELVARAEPDGYTLLLETVANATNMSIYKNLKYDTARDFAPISQIMAAPTVLVVTPSLPVKNLAELVALAKSKPGTLTFASSGPGGTPHLAGEMLKLRAGVNLIHVPYKGAAPALNDVLGGTVSMGFMTALSAISQMQSGKLRPIAVAGPRRMPELPDVPTMAEAGMPDFEVSSWNGLAAPAGTPPAIVEKLNAALKVILQSKEVQDRFQFLASEPVYSTPQQFAAYIAAETSKWGTVIEKSGAKIE
jgi:tripartite-type tricarboxylate transporter receptor subunit TctC